MAKAYILLNAGLSTLASNRNIPTPSRNNELICMFPDLKLDNILITFENENILP